VQHVLLAYSAVKDRPMELNALKIHTVNRVANLEQDVKKVNTLIKQVQLQTRNVYPQHLVIMQNMLKGNNHANLVL
jgi:hypothetical protein